MKISADSLPRHKQSDRVAQIPVRSAYTQVYEEVIQPRTAVEMGVSMRTPKPVNLHRNLDGASHQVAAAASPLPRVAPRPDQEGNPGHAADCCQTKYLSTRVSCLLVVNHQTGSHSANAGSPPKLLSSQYRFSLSHIQVRTSTQIHHGCHQQDI